jgi:hypothetical protein
MNFLRYWNISGLFRSNLPRVKSEAFTDPCLLGLDHEHSVDPHKYVIDLCSTIVSGDN